MACKIPRPKDPDAAARADVVELLFAYVDRLRVHFEGISKAHDLTPVQAKLLLSLGDKAPMRSLATELCCDPSNITGVVDRLEERGLISRTEDPEDRRVKLLQATPAGRKLRESFVAKLFADVPGMSNLSRSQVLELKTALGPLNNV
jgi:DNA-binding MarR family transcriptional regulator